MTGVYYECILSVLDDIVHLKRLEQEVMMLIGVDFRDKRPIYEQISGKLEELILCGVIGADEPLPSVRSLAMDLSINPNTIQKAYDNLEQRGFCYSVAGRGRFATGVSEVMPARREEFFDELDDVLQKAATLNIGLEELTGYVEENYPEIKDGRKQKL